jgi:hypothetical protein
MSSEGRVRKASDIQQAFDGLPETGGTVYLPSGTYEVEQTLNLELKEGQHLFLVGDGRTTKLVNVNTSGGALMHIVGAVGTWWPDLRITIRDLTFAGNHDSGDALIIEYPNDTMVDSCAFFGHGGKAIHLKVQGTNTTVRDCWMRDCKRALVADNLHHLTMHGNQTRGMRVSADQGQVQAEHVYLGANCRECRIVNNHFAYGDAEAIILDGTAQHVIANNCIEGFTKSIYAVDCRDMVVNANYLHSPKGIHLVGDCHAFSITGNTMINCPEGSVVVEDGAGSGGHVISGNVMRKSVYGGLGGDWTEGGVCLGEASDCVVNGNVIEEVCGMPAVSAGPGGGGHVIAANRIARNDMPGMALDCASECEVSGNLVDEA